MTSAETSQVKRGADNESNEADYPPFSSYGEDEDEWSESAQNEPAGGPQPGRIQPGKRVGVGISDRHPALVIR